MCSTHTAAAVSCSAFDKLTLSVFESFLKTIPDDYWIFSNEDTFYSYMHDILSSSSLLTSAVSDTSNFFCDSIVIRGYALDPNCDIFQFRVRYFLSAFEFVVRLDSGSVTSIRLSVKDCLCRKPDVDHIINSEEYKTLRIPNSFSVGDVVIPVSDDDLVGTIIPPFQKSVTLKTRVKKHVKHYQPTLPVPPKNISVEHEKLLLTAIRILQTKCLDPRVLVYWYGYDAVSLRVKVSSALSCSAHILRDVMSPGFEVSIEDVNPSHGILLCTIKRSRV